MNPILNLVHQIEIKLDRRLTDDEYVQFIKYIESQVTMMELNDWANNLPQEVKNAILNR